MLYLCERAHVYMCAIVSVCLWMAVCILVIVVLESMHIYDCEWSCEKVCWFGGAFPLNTIFTAVSASLFQPQVSVYQSPVALLQGWARFPFPVTDRDYNWKRMSRSSKQCSEALSTCLPEICAVMQTSMRRYSEFKCTTKQNSQLDRAKRKWNLCLYCILFIHMDRWYLFIIL